MFVQQADSYHGLYYYKVMAVSLAGRFRLCYISQGSEIALQSYNRLHVTVSLGCFSACAGDDCWATQVSTKLNENGVFMFLISVHFFFFFAFGSYGFRSVFCVVSLRVITKSRVRVAFPCLLLCI